MESSSHARSSLLALALLAAVPGLHCRTAAIPSPPEDFSAQFLLPEDLEITLWAESPMFFNPTNIDVDVRGRVWVTEAVNYRDFNHPEGFNFRPEGDRVVILEDTSGDGRADKSTVFVQDTDLKAPLGISVIDDKVIVSSSPSVIIYQADTKEVFLTGFGGYDHDHGLHVLIAGPDGRWYLNVGNQGPHMVTDKAGWTLRSGSVENSGSPYATGNTPGRVSDDGRIWTGGLVMRVNPDGTGLEVLAHNMRNSYETTIDSYGNMWQNDNEDQTVTNRTTWVMESGNMGYYGGGGSRRWQADRRPGQDAFTAHWHQEDPGVLPAGDRTGAGAPTGIVVYEDDALGPQYRGILFSADAGRNLVFGYRTSPDGAGFRLDRSDFLVAVGGTDPDYVWNEDVSDDLRKWFRPSDVAVGTDGALYVADWYDPIVGGHQMRNREASGRIYRIAPRGRKLSAPTLDLSTTEGQIQALLSPAINVRNAGFVRLREKGAAVLPDVMQLLEKENPYHRARAVWLMALLGEEGVREVRHLLRDHDPGIRITAYRALRQVEPDILPYASQLVEDPSPAVRREVALSLRDLSIANSGDLILALAEGFDGRDRWYLEALGTAADGKEEALYPLLRRHLGHEDPEHWDSRFAGIAWRLHPLAALDDLKRRAASAGVPEAGRKQALVAIGFIDAPAAAQAMADLTRSSLPDVARQAVWWLAYRQSNDWHGYPVEGARESPVASEPGASPEMVRLYRLLQHPASAIEERVDAAMRLAEDPTGGGLLIGWMAEETVSQNIRNVVGGALFQNPNRDVRVAAEQFFGPRGAMKMEDVAPRTGDAARGQGVFYAACASCHRMEGAGAESGPDLTGVSSKFDRTGLLEAVVNPGGGIAHGYESQLLITRSGQALFGFVLSEGPAVVFREISGSSVTIDRTDVDAVHTLKGSLMPRPAELGLSPQEVADVLAFLLSR